MQVKILGAALLLGACGAAAPEAATSGARLEAALEARWPTDGGPAREAAFSGDGALLATSDAGGRVTVRRTSGWEESARFDHQGGATAVAFSPDGKTLYSGGYDGRVRAWDLASRDAAGVYEGAAGTVWSVSVSPDGGRIAAAGEDAKIRVWRVGSPSAELTLAGHERNIWEVRFSPDGKRIASGSFDASVRLWDAATGAALKTLAGHEEAVVGLAFSPDGRVLASGGDDSTIRLWRAADGAPLRTIRAGNHVYKIAFSRDGRWLASAGRARGGLGTLWHQLTGSGGAAAPVRLWRTGDFALAAALPHPDDVMYVGFSPDGRRLVTSGEDGAARLWRLAERR
jgi:WD40 repeat protein